MEVETEDFINLARIIQLLIELKCSADPDGDYPIEFMLVNRLKEYSVWPASLPYRNDGDNTLIRHALSMINTGTNALELEFKRMEFNEKMDF